MLTIIQNATDEIGITRPSTVAGGTDIDSRQLLALLNREGATLAQWHDWPVLIRENEFSTASGTDEYAFPEDYDRLIGDSIWDRTNYWEMRGGLSPLEWQSVKSGLVNSPALRRRYRIKRSDTSSTFAKRFFVDPEPTSTDTLVYEYVSNQWATNAAGTTGKVAFTADDDEPILPADLLTLGLVWRWQQRKGLEFAAALAEYEILRDKRRAREGGMRTYYLASRRVGLPQGNTPDSGFGT